jgi:hypothetical protein
LILGKLLSSALPMWSLPSMTVAEELTDSSSCGKKNDAQLDIAAGADRGGDGTLAAPTGRTFRMTPPWT